MGIHQIQALIDNVWKKSITGDLLRVSMESLKLELGIQGSLFKCDYNIYSHLSTDCWIKNVWKFAQHNSIEIKDDIEGGALLQERDTMLAEKFELSYNLKMIGKTDWQAANRCRIYLKVLSVADIATGSGLEIDSNFWLGKIEGGRTRILEWPTQGTPSKKDWSTWRRVLRVSLGTETHRQLSISLGAWHETEASKELKNWRWFWDNENKIYTKRLVQGGENITTRREMDAEQGKLGYISETSRR